MTEIDKARFITELRERLNRNDCFLTIETIDYYFYKISVEWVSERGYYFSVYFRLPFPPITNLNKFWLEQDIIQKLNRRITNTINEWKEKEPCRIDDITNQPKVKGNRYIDIDPFGEEIWEKKNINFCLNFSDFIKKKIF